MSEDIFSLIDIIPARDGHLAKSQSTLCIASCGKKTASFVRLLAMIKKLQENLQCKAQQAYWRPELELELSGLHSM